MTGDEHVLDRNRLAEEERIRVVAGVVALGHGDSRAARRDAVFMHIAGGIMAYP
jgi:hypothetical protein